MAAAKQLLRPLTLTLIIPLSLTMITIISFGSSLTYQALADHHWLPPLWLIHLGSLSSSFLTGLSAWLACAASKIFHGKSSDVLLLHIYIAQVSLSLHWEPLVLRLGAARLGCFYCVVHFGTLVAWYQKARLVSPAAGVLVKPCLAWVAFLTYVSFKLIFI